MYLFLWFLGFAAAAGPPGWSPSVPGSCDILTLLPCNATIKTCYIYANVCSNTDIIFSGFGPSWTFLFVLWNIATGPRCNQTSGVLSSFCTNPSGLSVNNVTFPLSIVSRQGITDDNVTFLILPNTTSAYATLELSACPATLFPLTAILSIFGNEFIASNLIFSTGICTSQSTYVGLLASAATQSLYLFYIQFIGPQVGVVVLGTQAVVFIDQCNSSNTSTGLLPFTGNVLLVLKGCVFCSVTAPSSTLNQYAIFDLSTTRIAASSVTLYNISTIIPFTVYVPPSQPSTPAPAAEKCLSNTTVQIVIISIGSALLLIILIAIIRRHYQKTREKIN